MKKALFIEDNKTKSKDIRNFVIENSILKDLFIERSLTSGLKNLFQNDYDILLLDMSLPTRTDNYSIMNGFEQLGGYKILSEMQRKNRLVPTILITMFSEFGVGQSFMDIHELNQKLMSEFEEFYHGFVYYSSQEESWKSDLKNKLSDLL